MTLPISMAITIEQEQLAEAVTQFAARHAPIDKTRAALDSIAAGEFRSLRGHRSGGRQ